MAKTKGQKLRQRSKSAAPSASQAETSSHTDQSATVQVTVSPVELSCIQ